MVAQGSHPFESRATRCGGVAHTISTNTGLRDKRNTNSRAVNLPIRDLPFCNSVLVIKDNPSRLYNLGIKMSSRSCVVLK